MVARRNICKQNIVMQTGQNNEGNNQNNVCWKWATQNDRQYSKCPQEVLSTARYLHTAADSSIEG